MINRVVARLFSLLLFTIEARAAREVDFAADDRLHAIRAGLLVELDGPEEIAVICLRDSRHIRRLCPFKKRVVLDCTVEQRVLRMQMKMDEGRGHGSPLFPLDRGRRLARNVIDNAIDAGHFIDDAIRNLTEDVVRNV